MKTVIGGVPMCGTCMDTMRCVKNGALVVCQGGPVRRVYSADVFECECGARVVMPSREGFDLPVEKVEFAKHPDRLGKWLLEIPEGD